MKTKKPISIILGKIADILLLPILVIALSTSVFIFTQASKSVMPSFFGYSILRIQSGSMRASGYQIGDYAILEKTAIEDIKVGDIISFYRFDDPADSNNEKNYTQIKHPDQYIEITETKEDRKTLDDALENKVIFHMVDSIYHDATGARFFKTYGTSNVKYDEDGKITSGYDSFKIRETFVLGVGREMPEVMNGFLKWMFTPMAMICVVILPLGILVVMQSIALIEQINYYTLERRILKQQTSWDHTEILKFIKTDEMMEVVKIVLYSTVEPPDRSDVGEMLFHFSTKPTSKKKAQQQVVCYQTTRMLENRSLEGYFMFYKNNIKSRFDKKTIENYVVEFVIDA